MGELFWMEENNEDRSVKTQNTSGLWLILWSRAHGESLKEKDGKWIRIDGLSPWSLCFGTLQYPFKELLCLSITLHPDFCFVQLLSKLSKKGLAHTEQNGYVCVEWINNDSTHWNKRNPWFCKNCILRVNSRKKRTPLLIVSGTFKIVSSHISVASFSEEQEQPYLYFSCLKLWWDFKIRTSRWDLELKQKVKILLRNHYGDF